MIYPYSQAVVLNDTKFIEYGGHVGTTVAAQRQAAYLIAEITASEDIGTLLIPTIVTGTYHPNASDAYMLTDYAYVRNFYSLRMFDFAGNLLGSPITSISQGYYNVRNWDLGQVDLFHPLCGGIPYTVEYVYEAGLSTGTSNSPDVLLALTTYADIMLNEIMGYGNESVGDVGIQSFNNQQYSESRVKLLRTSFGTSARAQLAHKLLTRFRLHHKTGRGL